MRLKSFVLLVVTAALVVAVLAPAAFASAGVKTKLSGPREGASNAKIKLTCKISNPQKADGFAKAIILQNRNGHLKRIGSKAITWTNGGKTGIVAFWVEAQPTARGVASTEPPGCTPVGRRTATGGWSRSTDLSAP